jgi:hypothetical protein
MLSSPTDASLTRKAIASVQNRTDQTREDKSYNHVQGLQSVPGLYVSDDDNATQNDLDKFEGMTVRLLTSPPPS